MSHPIAKHLYAIQAATGEGFFRLWDDWLALTVAAFGRDDPAYMNIMSRYGPRVAGKEHPADHFARALGEFMRIAQAESALNGYFPDYLGLIYEQESLTNHYAGQFFTPEPVCAMMARMMIEPTDQPITICDPACGSGRFFIAAQPLAPKARFTGIDRDLTCVHMTALNMLLRNADADIVHGNTLSLETFGGYRTRSTVFGGEIRTLDAAQASSILTTAAKAQAQSSGSLAPTQDRSADATVAAAATPAVDGRSRAELPQPFVVDRKGQWGFDF